MERFMGDNTDSIELALPPPGGAKLLKLTYHLFYPGGVEDLPAEIVIKDQAGHELWRKKVTFKYKKDIEEVLLADMPGAADLTKLAITVYSKVSWVLQAKIYS
jgi:hypothetical protein